jgi:alkylresorcinol/alkylpyrone synthase
MALTSANAPSVLPAAVTARINMNAVGERRASSGVPAPLGVRVAGLGTALPPHRVTAAELAAALPRVWPRLARHGGALLRQVAGGERFFARPLDELSTGLPLAEQTARYLEVSLELATTAARGALAAARVEPGSIGCVVVASCTGFVLPGVDARLVPILGLREDVVRMPFAHFGCAGGAAGLARASDWLRAHPQSAALVVAVELPTVTFRPMDTSMDNLLSAMVFGDGAAAAVLDVSANSGTNPAGNRAQAALTIGGTRSVLVPGSTDALGYAMADDGYRVILERALPRLLEDALPGLVRRFVGTDAVRSLDVVAAHPGGPAILDAMQRALGLSDAQLAASWTTFRHTGNTSSAALLFVLAKLERTGMPDGAQGLILAVGPGLTVEMLELQWRA